MKLKIYLVLIMVIFIVSTVEGRSSSWSITERYSVTDFDKEGNNIYMGEDAYFYVDKIDMRDKELIIEKFDKQKSLVDVIKTGIIYNRTEKNQYVRKNSQIGIFFDKKYVYLYYPGKKYSDSFDELWGIDLETKGKKKIVNLEGVKGGIFGYAKGWGFYDDDIWDKGDYSYQIKLVLKKNKILLDGYYVAGIPEPNFAHSYYIFENNGKLLEKEYVDNYEEDSSVYPICLKENGDVLKGILAGDEMETLAGQIGYSSKKGHTDVYRGYSNSDLYCASENMVWLSKDLSELEAKDYEDTDFVSSIYGLIQENGKWKVKEFINPENFPELKYNVFIDRILKTEGNKLWLWVRIGHNITEAYEKRHFDREIWVIEKQ